MPFRPRFVRRRRSGPRPRTRWFALTPHALGPFLTDDSYDNQSMDIEDSAGAVPWQLLVGGTILRTIMDIVVDPVLGLSSGTQDPDYLPILHLGIFATEDEAPTVTRWDPNVPHGDFMWRYTWSAMMSARETMEGNPASYTLHEGNVVRVDTNIRRRIREDEGMWIAGHYFERLGGSGVDMSLTAGYTGRVLVQLP